MAEFTSFVLSLVSNFTFMNGWGAQRVRSSKQCLTSKKTHVHTLKMLWEHLCEH